MKNVVRREFWALINTTTGIPQGISWTGDYLKHSEWSETTQSGTHYVEHFPARSDQEEQAPSHRVMTPVGDTQYGPVYQTNDGVQLVLRMDPNSEKLYWLQIPPMTKENIYV